MHDSDLRTHNGGFSPGLMTFAFGAIVGAGVALLLAPDNGKNMRDRLKSTAKRLGENAADLKTDAKSALEAGRDAFTKSTEGRTHDKTSGIGSTTSPR